MNAALHGTAVLSTVVLLLAATTFACSSSDFEESGASNGTAGSGAASAGGPTGDAGESGGGVVSGGGSGGSSGGASGSTSTGGSPSGGSGTAGTGSGMGGEGGDEAEDCPDGRGSPMIRVPQEAGGFCIDAHETTRAEYADFLANLDQLTTPSLPEYCQSSNPSYEPSEGQNDADMDLPVVGVDYCDAYAYCTWAGKRMCGKIGGGATDYDAFNNAMESQWHAACSRGGTRVFPYGNNFDGALCNGADYFPDVPEIKNVKIAVETSQCEGGYEGIFDMSGNVWEWEDACAEDPADNLVKCRLRSGEFSNPEGFLRCDYGGFSAVREFATNSIGIRCCGP
ncbi:MAG TPA: formylglycine-generating enzyme family protein [Polyangiaceae bacterium]|nr:formylglycine-generating enzyme family protein [Polyangiaceae bacterium]